MEIKIENTLLGDIVIKDKDTDSGLRWVKASFNPPIPTDNPPIPTDNGLEIYYNGDTFAVHTDVRNIQVVHKSSKRFPLPVYRLNPDNFNGLRSLLTGNFSKCVHHRDSFLELLASFVDRSKFMERELYKELDKIREHSKGIDTQIAASVKAFEHDAIKKLSMSHVYTVGELKADLDGLGDEIRVTFATEDECFAVTSAAMMGDNFEVSGVK